jgi:type I restriction enzyme S subunit
MHAIYDYAAPSGWADEQLGSLVVTKRGCSWSKDQERAAPGVSTIPVVRIPNIQNRLDLTDLLHLEGVTAQKRAASAVAKGWTLMVGSNGNPKRIGDSVFMHEDREMVFASFLFALRPKQETHKLTDEFLSWWLQTHRVHEFISETSQMTTGLANMSWSACRKLPVRFPLNPAEQARIAETLKAADDHIRAIEDQIRKAERVKKSFLQTVFTVGLPWTRKPVQKLKWGQAPSGWVETTVRRLLTEPVSNGTSPHGTRDEPPGWPTLNVSSIRNGKCDQSKVSYIELPEQGARAFAVCKGDFFVLRGNGNRDYVAIGGLLAEEPRPGLVFSDLLIRLTFDTQKVVPNFVRYMWQSPWFLRRLQSYAITGSGLWKIGQRSISRFPLAIPDLQIQTAIADLFAAQDALLEALAEQLTSARRVKQSLLQNLLNGRIRLKP